MGLVDEEKGQVERLASDIAIRLGDGVLRRAGLESAPDSFWGPGVRNEEDAWFKGRDDTISFIQEDLEGCIRVAIEEFADQPSDTRDDLAGQVREKAQALLDALNTAEILAAGGEAQEANVNRVLTSAARELAFALAAPTTTEES